MARRIVDKVELKQTEPHGYEFVVGSFDYHLRLEDGAWILDQFRREVKDPDEAHVQSFEVESLREGVHFALEEAI